MQPACRKEYNMELTEVKGSLFGYKKADIVRYISELNEVHTVELATKSEAYDTLKESTDKEISKLTKENVEFKNKISALEEKISKLTMELKSSIDNYNTVSKKYDELSAETRDLRDKSEVISTAILNAEKCASQLIDDAKDNADDLIRNAEHKVRVEKEKLLKAKDCITDARAELKNTLKDIDKALEDAESEIDSKVKSIEDASPKGAKIDLNIFKRA